MSIKPAIVPAAVKQPEASRNPFLRWKFEQLLQRIRGPAIATGRGAGDSEPLHSLRMRDGELLRHHAAEAHSYDAAGVPTDKLKQAVDVGGDVSHRVGSPHRTATAEATVVPGQ